MQGVLLAIIVPADGGLILDVYVMLVQVIVQMALLKLVNVCVSECSADNIVPESKKMGTLALGEVL